MNGTALITLVLAQGMVIGFVAYFFYKVLTTPKKEEPDSYSDNDDQI
jgi:hypothetical protein